MDIDRSIERNEPDAPWTAEKTMQSCNTFMIDILIETRFLSWTCVSKWLNSKSMIE